MTTESKTWRLAKLASAREDAVRRLQMAVLRGAWRDAAAHAQQAADADEAIHALRAAPEQQPAGGAAP